jgi:hypothetical protein
MNKKLIVITMMLSIITVFASPDKEITTAAITLVKIAQIECKTCKKIFDSRTQLIKHRQRLLSCSPF